MKHTGPPPPHRRRRRRLPGQLRRSLFILLAAVAAALFLLLLLRISSSSVPDQADPILVIRSDGSQTLEMAAKISNSSNNSASCATVEEMGESIAGSGSESESEKESLGVREIIQQHFALHGAERVRSLPPKEFCKQGFVLGKASEAGFGNEMYKILTAAALSVMLNRSLIIGQTRGLYPFGEYINYTNQSFTLREVKHLWRKNRCLKKYGKTLKVRLDNFENPAETNVLCSDWSYWKQPIIWFQGTTDAVGVQFFLKNVNPHMRNAASVLFGNPRSLRSRPNIFGELIRFIISPTEPIKSAVNWVLNGVEPDISLHMRMLSNRSVRATNAAVECIKKAIKRSYGTKNTRPRVVIVSDTPSFIKDIIPHITDFAEVFYFDYKLYMEKGSGSIIENRPQMNFRAKDWGPAPRWAAFVDFFLASLARLAVVSGARRRVGTTFAQLIASLAAANQLGNNGLMPSSDFSFLSSFQNNVLTEGLSSQVGWGHVWNRFAGPASCRRQTGQCALTPLLPPAWWDTPMQSPIERDVRRLREYGVWVSERGEVDESKLVEYCRERKERVRTFLVIGL